MIRILFLAANPVDQTQLRQGSEYSAIHSVLDPARFTLIPAFAATPDQLQNLLFQHQPQIVHFSGHGDGNGLLFEDATGQSTPVVPETLRALFTHFADKVHCIVLNACYSQPHAAAIATVIDAVVGMGDAVSDDAATVFAMAFYRGLSNDKSLAAAVELGRNQIDLTGLAEADYPQLQADLVDATQVYARNWDDETNTSSATPRGIHGLYPFNKHFFGRDDELATLHSLLQSEPNVSICPTITGMGGLGKTQLAAHYARAHIADYPAGIFWITAADLNNIRPQLADFCIALNLPVADPQRTGDLTEQKISAFKAYLDAHPQALLIFDNVEEPDHLRTRQIGIGFTALTLGGKVLVTTRRRKLAGDHFAELPLERLLPEPARQILTTPRPDLATDPDLDRLCEQFGYLPLMLNLAAAALAKRGGAIAGYLGKLQEWGIDTLHDRARVSLADYHTSLTAVLQEQWAMLTSEDARLLLRVAGQLPEAEVIPTVLLGLLAGLRDVDEWECPLRDGVEELERASLVEVVDGETVRLHPLIREFAYALVDDAKRAAFRSDCAQRMADAYSDGINGLERLGHEYERRGISALLLDLITALGLAQSPIPNLQSLLRHLRLQAHHLQAGPTRQQATHLWQRLLLSTGNASQQIEKGEVTHLLRQTIHWCPHWRHHRQSPALEQTLSGHEGDVKGVAVLDAKRIVSASSDRTLKVWNLQSGEVEQTLSGHDGWVRSVAVVDAKRIVSASDDRTLKVWNLQSGQVEHTLTDHVGRVLCMAVVDGDRIVSAASDHTLKVWNLQTGQVEQALITGREDWVRGVAVVDGNRIVSASDDRTLKVWNLQTGQVEQTLTGHEDWVHSVVVVDSNRIVSASEDGMLKVWNLQRGQVEKTLTGHGGPVYSVIVVDSNRIVSASEDGTLKVWNLQYGQVEQTLTGHDGPVYSAAVVDGSRIVSASSDGMLKVWDLQSGQASPAAGFRRVEQTRAGHNGSVTDMAVVDASRIVSDSRNGTLKIWNLQTGQVEQTLTDHVDRGNGMAVADGSRIVSASEDSTLKVWNLQTGQVEQTLTDHKGWGNGLEMVNGVAMIDGGRIVSVSRNGMLKVWNLQTGQVEQTFTDHDSLIKSVAVVDGNRIVSASRNGPLKVWNLQTGQVEQTLTDHVDRSNGVAVVDANRIVSASDDHTLKVWNLQSGQVEQTLTGHEASVLGVAVVDPNRIVSTSADHTLKVWNLQTGEAIASIWLDGVLECVAVTHQDGRTLVVAGDAGGALYCLELVEPVGE